MNIIMTSSDANFRRNKKHPESTNLDRAKIEGRETV